MTRKLLPAALVLAIAAAACAKPPSAGITFGSGSEFVPQVADAQDDVGLYPSVAVDADGVPYVAYFGFPDELPKGEVALPRPIGAPSVPSVLLTSVNKGIWTRGAVAMEKAIPNVSVAFGPAEVPQVGSMQPDNVNGTAVAVDSSGGLHVVWVSNSGVWYAHNMNGTSFEASRVEKAKLAQRGPIGQPSIAVDSSGTPWVAYMRTTAAGQQVVVASGSGSSWAPKVVATVPLAAGGPQPGRVAVVSTSGGPVVLYADGSAVVSAAVSGGTSTVVEKGQDATGLSATVDADGAIHAAYYIDGEIHVATSKGGTTWQVATAGQVGTGDNLDGRSTGVGVDGQGTTYVAWYDPSTDDVRLASSSGSSFSDVETAGTTGGDLPALAAAGDGNVYVAWHDEAAGNLMLGSYGDVAGLELAVQSPTATGPATQPTSQPTGGEQCATAQDGELTVTASGSAFDTGCIQIPAGEKVTIHFDNQDAGTPHNLSVYPSAQQTTNPMFQHDPITGPAKADFVVGPFDAGDYYFQCDVHPTTMNGAFKVVAGGGAGSKGGGGASVTTSVSASGLAFDTSEIHLAAGKPTTLTFDNQDAGTPHNIAIYPSASQLTPDQALFQGEVVTGPTKVQYQIPALKAGTYYFHCDVHPTMNGTVIVA